MERQLWKQIVTLITSINKNKGSAVSTYTDAVIVKTWFWAVLNDRPVSWACKDENWPIWERRWKRPSAPTMSRRLKSKGVIWLLKQIENRVLRRFGYGNIVWLMDGKPLTVSGCSKDRQAGYGRAVGGMAKGYKIHAIVGSNETIADWRVAPMNKDERVMAKRIVRETRIQGYLLADSNYDANKLHQACDDRQNIQLVAPRRRRKGKGLGHIKHAAGRLRSIQILENPEPKFGRQLLKQRHEIERFFGNLTNWGGGLTHLPPWVRTYRRVQRWIQAKLIVNSLKRQSEQTTYVNP